MTELKGRRRQMRADSWVPTCRFHRSFWLRGDNLGEGCLFSYCQRDGTLPGAPAGIYGYGRLGMTSSDERYALLF